MDKDLITKDKDGFLDGVLSGDLFSKYILTEVDKRPDLDEAYMSKLSIKSKKKLLELKPQDSLQLMLCAQMLSVHDLQQKMVLCANQAKTAFSQGYINSVSKLSNLFVSQLTLLNKLQSHSLKENCSKPQSVHVHEGAQAVVGTVNCYRDPESTKNEK